MEKEEEEKVKNERAAIREGDIGGGPKSFWRGEKKEEGEKEGASK